MRIKSQNEKNKTPRTLKQTIKALKNRCLHKKAQGLNNIKSNTTDMKKKILFVEDNPFIKVLVEETLSEEYIIEFAQNGKEAMMLLQNLPLPDLILSDLSMPEMTGMELFKEISQSLILNEIPFVVLSASDSSEEKINCLELGITDYIVKPFNPRELFLRTKNIITKAA